MGRRMDAANVHMQEVRTHTQLFACLFVLSLRSWEDTMQILAILSIFGHESIMETCGVVIQYVYCSGFTGFSSFCWYRHKVKKEMKDSVRAIFLWGDTLQTHATEIQPVSVSVCVWQHGNFDISVALEFSIGLWGFETSPLWKTTLKITYNCNLKISAVRYAWPQLW